MKLKRFYTVLSTVVLIMAQMPCNVGMAETVFACETEETDACVQVIEAYVEAVQNKDWETFIDLKCSDRRESSFLYFSDDSNMNGIKQVEEIFLNNIYEADCSIVEGELLKKDYPILVENDSVRSFIVALDCVVNKENQYFFNGVNYFLMVLAEENSEMKIVQFNRPSMAVLEQVVIPVLNMSRTDSYDELAGINVIRQAERGLLINAQNEILTDGFELMDAVLCSSDSEGGVSICASGSNDFPTLSSYEYYSYPSSITVKLNKTGNGEIVTVDFETYIKNTLPKEWYGSWNAESLRAGAYCVKMVGWYRTLIPYAPEEGCDASQSTQMYVPNSEYPTTNSAVLYIEGYGMANSEGNLFFPEYFAGVAGNAGTQHSGKLSQWGSQYLASQQNYYHENILNYYYQGSCYSDGNLVFFYYQDNVQ